MKLGMVTLRYGMTEPRPSRRGRKHVQLYILGTHKDDRYLCGARVLGTLNPDSDEYTNVRKTVDDGKLAANDGSGALAVVDEIKKMLGPRSLQEAVRLTLKFVTQADLKRKNGEGMRAYLTRFEGRYTEAGNALKEACGGVDPEKFLHPLVRGILLMEGCQLEVPEQNAVLATSGKDGNSWLFDDLKTALQLQRSDDAMVKHGKSARGRRAQAHQLEAQAFEISELRGALENIEEEQEYDTAEVNFEQIEDDVQEYIEESEPTAEDHNEEFDEETAMAADVVVEQFGGDVDDAEAFAFEQASSAARSFQEARRLLSEVRGARGYFPVVGIAALPAGESSHVGKGRGQSRGAGRGGQGKGKGAGRPAGGRGVYGRGRRATPPSQFSWPDSRRNDDTPPMAKSRQATSGPQRGGRHHGPRSPGPVCLICRQAGHIAKDCPTQGSDGVSAGPQAGFGQLCRSKCWLHRGADLDDDRGIHRRQRSETADRGARGDGLRNQRGGGPRSGL